MKPLATGLGLLAMAIASLAPTAALAQEDSLVPPGNAAVNQYTEGFPTARGNEDPRRGEASKRSPHQVLGKRNAQRLERYEQTGQAVAELAAETAPREASLTASTDSRSDGRKTGGDAAVGGDSDQGGAEPDGTSAASEVAAQATGVSSDGNLGLLLPVALILTAIWAIAYAWRRTRESAV